MKIVYSLVAKIASTLLGLSFAAVTFSISLCYIQSIPLAMQSRMISVGAFVLTAVFLFFVSAFLSFFAFTFLAPRRFHESRRNLGKASVIFLMAGLIALLFGFLTLAGVGLIINLPFPATR